jgi:hypothetical protein
MTKNETTKVRRFEPSQKHTRDYSTVARLDAALQRLGFADLRHTVYHFEDGRVTALFLGQDANIVIFSGFCWVGM